MKQLFVMLSLFACITANENLIVKETVVHAIASFDMVDYFATYSRDGQFLWEIPFSSKIDSIQENNNQILVLSQAREGGTFFVTCIDKDLGKIIWEKRILAPGAGNTSNLNIEDMLNGDASILNEPVTQDPNDTEIAPQEETVMQDEEISKNETEENGWGTKLWNAIKGSEG